MYVKNGIAYADEPGKILSVKNVRPLNDYKLRLTFSNGEIRIYDFAPMLEYPAFRALKDKAVFNNAYVDCGTVTWNGETDIASEALYKGGIPVT
ncbi:MAG: DUF2442 domain-containing protein [Clostridiales Family XIII bacterium]|jgi:hypothetical protein|nr:DUF2442 domain-containing protein [Clostridiales Family XIII bacterium]